MSENDLIWFFVCSCPLDAFRQHCEWLIFCEEIRSLSDGVGFSTRQSEFFERYWKLIFLLEIEAEQTTPDRLIEIDGWFNSFLADIAYEF